MTTLRIGIVQSCTGRDRAENTRQLEAAITDLAGRGASIVFTPEMSAFRESSAERLRATATSEEKDETLKAVQAAARTAGTSVLLGSIAIDKGNGKFANRSFLIGPDGRLIARYDKIHMFDAQVASKESYAESRLFEPGTETVIAETAGVKLGLTICYDLRFPALHRLLAKAGAQILVQPSAFTVPTGKAHWHTLLRARAIETGCFVVAAAQSGLHEDGRQTFGHSLVVSPWGEVLLDMGTETGLAVLDLDLGKIGEARGRLPSLQHDRPLTQPVSYT